MIETTCSSQVRFSSNPRRRFFWPGAVRGLTAPRPMKAGNRVFSPLTCKEVSEHTGRHTRLTPKNLFTSTSRWQLAGLFVVAKSSALLVCFAF